MGFNSVYRVLQEVFPQIDSRVLRAVAIEHPKDPAVAVVIVTAEVIPFLSRHQTQLSNSSEKRSTSISSKDSCKIEQHENVISVETVHPDGSVDGSSSFPLISEKEHFFGDSNELTASANGGNDDKTSPDLSPRGTPSISSSVQEQSSTDNRCAVDDHVQGGRDCEGEDSLELSQISDGEVLGSALAGHGSIHQEQSCVNGFPSELKLSMPESPDSKFMLEAAYFLNGSSKEYMSACKVVNLQEQSAVSTVDTGSQQICSVDLLENIIEDAKNYKKTLVTVMDSVIQLMSKADDQEKAAKQAKEEASQGCLDILARVEELKQTLQRAKEANDMHASEVYAERAILATEVKELQARLQSLAEEKDKSLGLLDEMRQLLEFRLNKAEKEKDEAEQEQAKNEASARDALAYQELIMEKVVEESKMVKQEAEENSKLQEFLMDRGRLVDMLQGEISVKCQDVKLLKQKFDRMEPLIFSPSSSQTIMLTSSSSFLRSIMPCELDSGLINSAKTLDKSNSGTDSHEALENNTVAVSLVNVNLSSREGKVRDDLTLLADEGWEFFEKHDVVAER